MEVQVAVSIFIVMMLSAMGIFKSVLDSQQGAITAKNVQESIRYVMEAISKELRSARRSDGTEGCGVPAGTIYFLNGGGLHFINKSGDCVKYYKNNNALMIDRKIGGTTYVGTTTPSNVRLKEFNINIPNVAFSQPRVTIEMVVDSLDRSVNKQDIRLQTTISSRFYN